MFRYYHHPSHSFHFLSCNISLSLSLSLSYFTSCSLSSNFILSKTIPTIIFALYFLIHEESMFWLTKELTHFFKLVKVSVRSMEVREKAWNERESEENVRIRKARPSFSINWLILTQLSFILHRYLHSLLSPSPSSFFPFHWFTSHAILITFFNVSLLPCFRFSSSCLPAYNFCISRLSLTFMFQDFPKHFQNHKVSDTFFLFGAVIDSVPDV